MTETVQGSRYLAVPLADELFDCHQGDFRSYHTESIPNGEAAWTYHTYSNTTVGGFKDPDVETTLRLAFEEYLRRLFNHCPPVPKPRLFWRFRIGEHIMLEWNGKKRGSRVKLYTRLRVPDCSLIMCPRCLRTEGEEHNAGCENIVRGNHG